jgi:hypothetical protein
MRRLILLLNILFLSASAIAQRTDTFYFVESASIQLPDPINYFYVEDLNGDNYKELIVCTYFHIYVYDGSDRNLIWTSPELLMPSDLKFDDFDGDSLIDISCKCPAAIYLFDPFGSNTIWTSPELDERYVLYNIGDRNNDGGPDIAIVIKGPSYNIDHSSNRDTVWIKLYDYPVYDSSYTRRLFIYNYSYSHQDSFWPYPRMIRHFETPTAISINPPLGGQAAFTIMLYCSIEKYDYMFPFYDVIETGSVRILNAANLTQLYTGEYGNPIYQNLIELNDSNYVCAVSSLKEHNEDMAFNHFGFADILSSQNRRLCDTLWSGFPYSVESRCRGVIMADIIEEILGPEICFGIDDPSNHMDFIALRKMTSDSVIWSRSTFALDTVLCIFKSSILSHPQVVVVDGNNRNTRFIDVTNGNITGILDYGGYGIDKAADYNNDGNDEVFSFSGSILHIGSIQTTGIDEAPLLPGRFTLSQNYPNPFNAQTTIRYAMPAPSNISIDIFEIMGRKVETLLSEKQQAGEHTIVWNADGKPFGIYFYRLRAGNVSKTEKCILLK